MFEKILVVDDDFVALSLIEAILKEENYNITSVSSPVEALELINNDNFDLIISDYYMPEMNGNELLEKVRNSIEYIPFIIVTVSDEIQNAIDVLKAGANDYIIKPINPDDLKFHVEKNLKDIQTKKVNDRIRKEREILELEKKQLVNWKLLYASKDVKQTDQVIKTLTRNFNQGGSFVWLELLKNNIKKVDEKNFMISKSLVDLIIRSSEENKRILDVISFLADFEEKEFDPEKYEVVNFINELQDYIMNDLGGLFSKYNRNLKFQQSKQDIAGQVSVDMGYFKKSIRELILNSIKYSPENSDIILGFEKNYQKPGHLDIIIKNLPKELGTKDVDGNKIIGIPFEYSELIFDLFYSIEPYPNVLPEEEWTNGTGLYIVRKLLSKFGAWVSSANEIDYTKGSKKVSIKFTITILYK